MEESIIKEKSKLIKSPDKEAMKKCQIRLDNIAKPLRSLGYLEQAIVKIAGMTGNDNVDIKRKALIIMCADNGVVEENVTQVGKEITALVADNFTKKKSTVCIMSSYTKTDIFPVDIGIDSDVVSVNQVIPFNILNKKIAFGTKNIYKENAMTRKQSIEAIETGIELVRELKEKGYNIIATGEMGIGNTTTSSAVASVILNKEVEYVTGKGAGLSSEGLERKINVIKHAIEINKPDPKDPIDVLAKVGGFDIAGLMGVFIGGALYKVPIVIDGFISGVAAVLASKMNPLVIDYILPSHVSNEPAGKMILEELGLAPFITCGMFLGEGTGAVALFPLLDMVCNVYNQMSTFNEINMDNYVELK